MDRSVGISIARCEAGVATVSTARLFLPAGNLIYLLAAIRQLESVVEKSGWPRATSLPGGIAGFQAARSHNGC
jgi:hypothetical protein